MKDTVHEMEDDYNEELFVVDPYDGMENEGFELLEKIKKFLEKVPAKEKRYYAQGVFGHIEPFLEKFRIMENNKSVYCTYL